MVRAVIFDLNGVFIRSPKLSERFRERFGVAENIFVPVLQEIMAKVRLPEAGDAFSYWQGYLRQWGLSISEEEFFAFWFAAEREVPEMVALAKGLRKKGIKVFILSNNFSERTGYYQKHFSFLAEAFDKVYYSWQTGFVKPNPEVYQNLLRENSLKPGECLYFDDNEENVKVAKSLGTTKKTLGEL